MSGLFETICLALISILIVIPALYGFHMYLLMYLAHRRYRTVRDAQREQITRYQRETSAEQWPLVTTQIPLYNELTVARRIIEAAAKMDYPRGRHEIQVLDDSTDATREIVDQVARELRRQGRDVTVLRRADRRNYKAGALAEGVRQARGEFLAVFDADFVPTRDFLRNLIPLIATDPRVCCAQGRWGHLNVDESWITQGLALGLDMHFGIEQGARNWNNLPMNFNGTAGIWRKSAINAPGVGGWHGDTITEDLDLSYRAQLAGWKLVYCMDVVAPAELPADVDALKSQQRRWATGSIQTARKLLPLVWRSRLSFLQKLEASFHLTQYSISRLMLAVALFGRLLPVYMPTGRYPAWLQSISMVFLVAAIAPSLAYIYGRRLLGGRTGFMTILKLMVLGLGLSVNNGVAVLVGLFQRGGEFVRTPKSGSQDRAARGATGKNAGQYAALRSRLWICELALAAFCFGQWLYFLRADGYIGGTFLLLFAIGLFLMGWGSRPRRKHPPARAAAPSETAAVGCVEPAL